MDYKIKDLVCFHVINDDSGNATDLYDVEPQCNWFETIVYCEEIFCEVIKIGKIVKVERINLKGEKTGLFYSIKNNKVIDQIEKFKDVKYRYNLKLSDIFEDTKLKTLKDFEEVKRIPFISIDSIYCKKNCKDETPKTFNQYSIWEKCKGMGYNYVALAYFKNGKWISSKGEVVEITDKCYWDYSLKRKYINGSIVLDKGIHYCDNSN